MHEIIQKKVSEIPLVFDFMHENIDGLYYYVLMHVYEEGRSEEEGITVVAARKDAFSHSHAAECFWHRYLEGTNLKQWISGGGYIGIAENGQTITIDGKSVSYGEANHKITAQILQKNFPSSKIIVS